MGAIIYTLLVMSYLKNPFVKDFFRKVNLKKNNFKTCFHCGGHGSQPYAYRVAAEFSIPTE